MKTILQWTKEPLNKKENLLKKYQATDNWYGGGGGLKMDIIEAPDEETAWKILEKKYSKDSLQYVYLSLIK